MLFYYESLNYCIIDFFFILKKDHILKILHIIDSFWRAAALRIKPLHCCLAPALLPVHCCGQWAVCPALACA